VRKCLVILLPCLWLVVACVPKKDTQTSMVTESRDALLATVWMQNSAEYEGLTRTIFHRAGDALEDLVAKPDHTAFEPQKDDSRLGQKPPALLIDLDETVFDNSSYQVELMRRGESFNQESWSVWVNMARAKAVPGALAFLHRAQRLGVTVFYVSNRLELNEQPTLANLEKLGAPMVDGIDITLLKEETSDKEPRRLKVAETHRIVMMLGDTLGDFHSGYDEADIAKRDEWCKQHRAHFGYDWFVLPNPVYGKWDLAAQKAYPDLDATSARMKVLSGYE